MLYMLLNTVFHFPFFQTSQAIESAGCFSQRFAHVSSLQVSVALSEESYTHSIMGSLCSGSNDVRTSGMCKVAESSGYIFLTGLYPILSLGRLGGLKVMTSVGMFIICPSFLMDTLLTSHNF